MCPPQSGFTIVATDGEIGSIEDIYFDAKSWHVRYVVVDTDHWLTGRQVVIGPQAVIEARWSEKRLLVNLTKAQVEGSPDVSLDPPVSRQHEIAWHRYYDYPFYWTTPEVWPISVPGPLPVPSRDEQELAAREMGGPDLHSARTVAGYELAARDGDIGHVEDFLLDSEAWVIRYIIVDTRNWLPGKHVLVSPGWIRDVRWDDSRAYVDLSKDAIQNSPECDPNAPVEPRTRVVSSVTTSAHRTGPIAEAARPPPIGPRLA
jgi:hypothetical protein